ncbi:MAG: hypothetical protein HGA42_02055, partial [Nostocales cyanobacterium W4_Combined_metabat2_030]|nr:hypothetical protein [Nostocales cyanobacterium W4_Combined_metabat2_030]
ESNVRGCWFFRTAPKELREYDEHLKADKEIPAFKIFKDENSMIDGGGFNTMYASNGKPLNPSQHKAVESSINEFISIIYYQMIPII